MNRPDPEQDDDGLYDDGASDKEIARLPTTGRPRTRSKKTADHGQIAILIIAFMNISFALILKVMIGYIAQTPQP